MGYWEKEGEGEESYTLWSIAMDSFFAVVFQRGMQKREVESPHLLEIIEEEISSFIGDKGYDQISVYKAVLLDSKEAQSSSTHVQMLYFLRRVVGIRGTDMY